MSNVLRFATARKTSRANLVKGWFDGGKVLVYTATKPADSDTAITDQTLLVTFEIPETSGTVSNGVFTGADIEPALVEVTGTPSWARLVDSDDATIGDVDVGLTGSGEFIELDSLSLVEGAYCAVSSFGLTEG